MKTASHLAVLLLLILLGNASAQVPAAIKAKLPSESRYLWAEAVGEAARNPAKAIIVSRRQFERLRPVRSWQDFSALRDYVQWADRAEAAGFSGNEVLADLGSNDLVLLRIPFASVAASVKVMRDPIGYAVLDPGVQTSKVRCPATTAGAPRSVKKICVTVSPARSAIPDMPANLPIAPIPLLEAAVQAASDVVTVYGTALSGTRVRVFSRKGEGQVLYSAANQINARLPSIDEVCVEIGGLRSDWAEVLK